MASNTKRKRDQVSGPEIGESGVQIFNGIITGEEYNRKLSGPRAIAIWDEMRRSDATVGASLRAVKLPIKSAKYFTTAASEETQDVEIETFVSWNLFERLKWKSILGEILTHLDYGFSVHEMVFGMEIVNGVERIVLQKIAFRKQTTITAWEAEKGVPGVTQRLANGDVRHIPLNKLIVFTNEQEGDNYEGRSILRAAYKHWFYKDKLYQIDAVGHERQALGVVKIKYPTGATDKQRVAAKKAAANLRANEEAYIEEPVGWDINFMDMKASSLKDVQPSIDHHDRQISKNVLAQFLELGAKGGSGSRATSEDHSKLFDLAGEAVAEYVADIMGYVIKTLVDLNFNVSEYPKMSVGKIGDENIPALAETVAKFETAGLITVSDEDEAHVRNLIGFPEMGDDSPDRTKDSKAKDSKSAKDIKDEVKAAQKLHASVTRRLYDRTRRAA
jgi:phage gp29-like protein